MDGPFNALLKHTGINLIDILLKHVDKYFAWFWYRATDEDLLNDRIAHVI